jgi:hypothetical protein
MSPTYEPAERGADVLYRVVEQHLDAFVDRAEASGRSLPRRVVREFEAYLACGIPAFGFALLRCVDCGTARTVAFSCKRRGFCPSCCGRRMNTTAAHLVDRVFPEVAVRQWVLSLPMWLRFPAAWDGALCRRVLATFLNTVFEFYRERAAEEGFATAQCGAVTFAQPFGSFLNANLHFHSLVPDGFWVEDGTGTPVFHPTAPPTTAEVQQIVDRVRERVERWAVRRGHVDEDGEVVAPEDADDAQQLMLAASVAGRAALGERAGRKPRALRKPASSRTLPNRCAASGWFNLHAGVRVAPQDSEGLERLCRYIARPPLSHDRLTEAPDGRLVVRFKRPWADGTNELRLEPLELLARLAAIIPQRGRNQLHYHGVFAPAARLRAAIVPTPPVVARHPLLPPSAQGTSRSSRWLPWADLLTRVFAVDGLACSTCRRPMRVHAVVQGVWPIRHVLACLKTLGTGSGAAPARAPPPAAA